MQPSSWFPLNVPSGTQSLTVNLKLYGAKTCNVQIRTRYLSGCVHSRDMNQLSAMLHSGSFSHQVMIRTKCFQYFYVISSWLLIFSPDHVTITDVSSALPVFLWLSLDFSLLSFVCRLQPAVTSCNSPERLNHPKLSNLK